MEGKDFVYSRIGMALVSAQRVEFIAGELLSHLKEFSTDFSMITTEEFLVRSSKKVGDRMTLGAIFQLHKLNPKLVIEDELDSYLQKRNHLAHELWRKHLYKESNGQSALDFCYDFGQHSNRIEKFFKGYLYFLALRHVKDCEHLHEGRGNWRKEFEYFLNSFKEGHLE